MAETEASATPNSAAPRARHTLPRSSRLKRRRLIRPLFARRAGADAGASTVAAGCVRLLYRIVPREELGGARAGGVQIGFAPGRRAKTAVRRNRIKRLLREAYRPHHAALVGLLASYPHLALTGMVLFRAAPEQADASARRDMDRLARRLRKALPDDLRRAARRGEDPAQVEQPE